MIMHTPATPGRCAALGGAAEPGMGWDMGTGTDAEWALETERETGMAPATGGRHSREPGWGRQRGSWPLCRCWQGRRGSLPWHADRKADASCRSAAARIRHHCR